LPAGLSSSAKFSASLTRRYHHIEIITLTNVTSVSAQLAVLFSKAGFKFQGSTAFYQSALEPNFERT
jgi:hypothetical protein